VCLSPIPGVRILPPAVHPDRRSSCSAPHYRRCGANPAQLTFSHGLASGCPAQEGYCRNPSLYAPQG
jgi:hypothetical protein